MWSSDSCDSRSDVCDSLLTSTKRRSRTEAHFLFQGLIWCNFRRASIMARLSPSGREERTMIGYDGNGPMESKILISSFRVGFFDRANPKTLESTVATSAFFKATIWMEFKWDPEPAKELIVNVSYSVNYMGGNRLRTLPKNAGFSPFSRRVFSMA